MLLGSHHGYEFIVVDLSVAVNVCLPDHLVDLLVRELLPEVGHHVPQLSGADETIPVLVEHSESLPDLLLAVGVLHLASHHREELGEIYCTVTICIHLKFKIANCEEQ